jgi:uncharacterized damage-inducible protein DinB
VIEMKEILQRLISHMQWADQQVQTRLREAKDETAATHMTEAIRLYAHVVGAERVWLLRLQNQDWRVQKVWPTLSIDASASLAQENASAFAGYLATLAEADLAREIAYVNSQGDSFTSTVADILIHVAVHGSHHRGQIATTLRRIGAEPPNVDYIRFARGR